MTEVNLRLVDGLKFDVETGSGNKLRIDTADVADGGNTGPGPMELILVSLGGCGAMDVISVLRKMRQDVTAYEVRVTGDRALEHPKLYTSAVIVHRLRGPALSEAQVRRAIFLSMSRYCPVFAMLAPTVPIAVGYEIEDEAGGPVVSGFVQTDVPEPATET